jgi:prepilin-type N-terminal cleavage/methylation domain-containing protein
MPRTRVLYRLAGRSGFSAVEILIAVAVVAVIAILALPTYLNHASNRRLVAASRMLLTHIRATQQEALSKRVAISVNAARADVACPSGAASYTMVAGEEVVKRVCLAADVAWAERPTATFTFDATGVPSSGATFALRSVRTGRTHTVTVTPGGELSSDAN